MSACPTSGNRIDHMPNAGSIWVGRTRWEGITTMYGPL
jgi:hypothetical protein